MKEELDKYHQMLNDPSQEVSHDDEISQFLEKATKVEVPNARSKEDIWDAIDAQTAEKKSRTLPIYFSIAAAVALLIISVVLFIPGESSQLNIVAEAGESFIHELPDGSKVTLNAASMISYSDDWNRTIQLEGEAFFEVTKGSKFSVNTQWGEVSVLGTSFNVYSRESFRVNCKTGKVKVAISDSDYEKILEPGEGLSKVKTEIKDAPQDISAIGQWIAGEFYFEERLVTDVFLEVERQFGVKIPVGDVEGLTFSGYFSNENLETALEMICLPLDLEYEIQGDTVIIKSNI
ncbi:MAG: FecR domain-containing protein [Cyclobacteriaceae bacterium]